LPNVIIGDHVINKKLLKRREDWHKWKKKGPERKKRWWGWDGKPLQNRWETRGKGKKSGKFRSHRGRGKTTFEKIELVGRGQLTSIAPIGKGKDEPVGFILITAGQRA